MTLKKRLAILFTALSLCTSSFVACESINSQSTGDMDNDDMMSSSSTSVDEIIPTEQFTEQPTEQFTEQPTEQPADTSSLTSPIATVITPEEENNVKKFVLDEFGVDCTLSYEPLNVIVLTNDAQNPKWMWDLIWMDHNYSDFPDMDDYAAYWEICDIPKDAIVIWEMENGKYACSEQSEGYGQYYDYTGNNKYLFTGRSSCSACYCYCSVQTDFWSSKYCNIKRAWLLNNATLYLAVQN